MKFILKDKVLKCITDDKEKIIINENFSIIRGVNELNKEVLVKIKYLNIAESIVDLTLGVNDFNSEKMLFKNLNSKGFPFTNDPEINNALIKWMQSYSFEETYLLTPQTGWKIDGDKYAYVLPDKTFGMKHYPVKFCGSSKIAQTIDKKGNWKEYKNTLELAQCSPTIIFAVGVGLASMLIEPLNSEIFGVHLFGESSTGKTTAIKFVTSFFSNPTEYISWKVTKAGLEKVCLNYNGRPLTLDEAKMIGRTDKEISEKISEASYTICDGRDKEKSEAWIKTHDILEGRWAFTFLSSGEFSIITKALDAMHKKDGGEKLRFIDVPAEVHEDYGIIEYLPKGFNNSGDIIRNFEKMLSNNYGHLGRKYAKKLTDVLNSKKRDGFLKDSEKFLANTVENLAMSKAYGYTKRYTKRFAIVHLALLLGVDWGLIPWDKKTINKAMEGTYFKAIECVESDEQILSRGLDTLKFMLNKDNPQMVNLNTNELTKEEVKNAMKKGKYFLYGKKDNAEWLVPSSTFKGWFGSEYMLELVMLHIDELLPEKVDDAYPAVLIGKSGARLRMLTLNRNKLNKLLGE